MRASEIITGIEKRIKIETKKIERHKIAREMLTDILHMAKKNGYIEKKELKENAPPSPLNPDTSFNKGIS